MDLSRIARGGQALTLDRPRIVFYDAAASWALARRFGPQFLREIFLPSPDPASVEIKDADALAFALTVGLQADAKDRGETVTLEQVQGWMLPEDLAPVDVPGRLSRLGMVVMLAITRATATPPVPEGKAGADAAGPAADAAPKPGLKKPDQGTPGPTRASTTLKRSASPTRSSGSRRPGSGPALLER